jgi:type VI secretion system protein ImpF
MAEKPARTRLNPTLFDKLVASNTISGMRGAELEELDDARSLNDFYSVPEIERFNEGALRATVRREVTWLLNTINLDSAQKLEAYPQVQSSVVNYGVPELSGKPLTNRLVLQRARDIRTAIQNFEPRIDRASLEVEISEEIEQVNSITFVIKADVRNAVRALPVKFRTDLEVETADVTLRD